MMQPCQIRFLWPLIGVIMVCCGHAFAQNAPSKASPFEQMRWVNGQPEVYVQSKWYKPVAINGVDVQEILDFCNRQWPGLKEKRFGEDLVEAMKRMGHKVPVNVDLALIRLSDQANVTLKMVAMTNENRNWIRDARNGNLRGRQPRAPAVQKPASRLSKEMALADILEFQSKLNDQFAYLNLRGIDLEAELNEVRWRIKKRGITPAELAEQLNTVLAKFGDGHAGVFSRMAERPAKYPPFLLQDAEGGVVAFRPDRRGFLDEDRPYILAIDGVSIDDWLDQVRPNITHGSPQLIRARGLRALRDIDLLRFWRIGKGSDTLTCTLASGPDDTQPVEVEVPLVRMRPTYGPWPRRTSGIIDDNIGYLRIEQMSDRVPMAIRKSMEEFRDTDGLIIDVRGNGGGTRTGLITLAGYLLGPDEGAWVGSTAKYRLSEEFDWDHLEARYMYRVGYRHWTGVQQKAINAFAETFKPEWDPGEGFSEWHYLVLDRTGDEGEYFYDKPVIILSDANCFSATDIFLGALADRPRITLLGKASGGGSARSQGFVLGNSWAEVRCASMASFRPDGRTYDGRGIEVDIEVESGVRDCLVDGGDQVLDAAIERLRTSSP